MADLRDIDNVLQKFENKFYQRIAKAQVQVARNVLIKLAERTPVDTGRCQSNWVMTEHTSNAPYDPDPPTIVTDEGPQQYTRKHGDRRGVSYELARSNARTDAKHLSTKVLVGRTIKPVYIHNRTPYLRYLDRGHSPQAAPGFIRTTATAEYRRRIQALNAVLSDTIGVTVAGN